MKKIIAKLRTKSFWVALTGALALILTRLGISDATGVAEKAVEIIGSLLLMFGIVVSPAAEKSGEKDCGTDLKSEKTDEPDKGSES